MKEAWYIKAQRHFTNWIKDGGFITIYILAFFGIFCAMVGYYGTVGFDWARFIFMELPLYIFCGWALVMTFTMVKRIRGGK